tara:strand:+ start:4308 stop:4688 length:381 start_codon:yes stop_codon:yes gene_type:complete
MNNSEYKIPEGYFTQKKAALKQIPQQERRIFKLPRWQKGLTMAASLALLIATGIYYLNFNSNSEESLNKVSLSALDEFISYSPYSAYPETYLYEESDFDLEEMQSEQLFDEEQLDSYLDQYSNEFL